ncbi:MAG: hypothetical protein QNL04_15260 [SAR324 cluster bacterium]|nr:hypothetical protein [SAR324 cluster bacterium]
MNYQTFHITGTTEGKKGNKVVTAKIDGESVYSIKGDTVIIHDTLMTASPDNGNSDEIIKGIGQYGGKLVSDRFTATATYLSSADPRPYTVQMTGLVKGGVLTELHGTDSSMVENDDMGLVGNLGFW